jgi:hypothetical protein
MRLGSRYSFIILNKNIKKKQYLIDFK